MRELYNQELKERYIIEKESETILSPGALERCFGDTKEFEERLKKDVSNFTFYEILDMYKTWNMSSYDGLVVLNSYLSQYTQWCLQQCLVTDSQNHFLEMNKELYLSCINKVVNDKKIVDRRQVINWANQLRNPSDSFLLLALFEGIKGKEYIEISKLKISDFHNGKVKLCTGREVTVSDELYNFALKASQEQYYYSVTGGKVIKLADDYEKIIKEYPNIYSSRESEAGNRIRRRIERNYNVLGIEHYMTRNAITESGIIHFIKKRCQEDGLTPIEYLKKNTEEIENQFEKKIHRPAVFYDKYKEYLD